MFWTYIGFSQFMLIWYGNIPEETEWFFFRQQDVWFWISLSLIFLPLVTTVRRDNEPTCASPVQV